MNEDESSEVYDFTGLQRTEQSHRVVGGGRCGAGGPEKDDWNLEWGTIPLTWNWDWGCPTASAGKPSFPSFPSFPSLSSSACFPFLLSMRNALRTGTRKNTFQSVSHSSARPQGPHTKSSSPNLDKRHRSIVTLVVMPSTPTPASSS